MAIYCRINGKGANIQHTHPNNNGIITTFVYWDKGNCSADSFSLNDFNSVEDFIKHRYNRAKILNRFNDL